MHDHYDHHQTLVPASFVALHSRDGRAFRPRAEIESRYDSCENVALQTAAFLTACQEWPQPSWLSDVDRTVRS